MRPEEFDTLHSIDQVYHNNERLHQKIYEFALQLMRRTPSILAHRDYVATQNLGFGDYAFHGVWSLLVDAMPDRFRFLEIGVYKGNITSLVGMIAYQRGKDAHVVGVSSFDDEGDGYTTFARDEDYIGAVRSLEKWCSIPQTHFAKLIKGPSQDDSIREACRADGPYDLVFIDGSKAYHRLVADLVSYGALVAPGGYLVVCDASMGLHLPSNLWPGRQEVTAAVSTFLDQDIRFRHVAAFGSMRIWTKRANDRAAAQALATTEVPLPLRFAPSETRKFGGTSDRVPDLVLAFVANYSFAQIEPFVATLLTHGQNIHLTLFVDNMDEVFHILGARLNVEIIDAKPYLSPDWHMNNIRFKMYDEYLASTQGRWRNILLTDVRDVVFQADPFAKPLPAPVVFAAEDVQIGSNETNYSWLVERYGRIIADELASYPVVCAGTTIGSAGGIIAYTRAIWTEISDNGYDHRHNFDQASHNYLAWHVKPEWAKVDLEDTIVGTVGVSAPERTSVENERIIVDGKTPSIVHQWDRKPHLVAFIDRSPSMRLRP